MSQGRLKVIIAGAGIAGASTAIALQRLPHLDVELYEQATELKEIGASIAISPNGLRTLDKLGVWNALDDNVGFRGPSGLPMIYRDWKTNQVIHADRFLDVSLRQHQTTRFHRAHLHAALLQHIPPDRIHLNKRAVSVTVDPKHATLYFADGTSVQGDVLIGADGIHSKVRQSFLPNHNLKWTGKIFLRSAFDASLVEGIENLPVDSAHWWGPTENFFASRLGKNQYTTVSNFEPRDASEEHLKDLGWDSDGSVQLLKDRYKHWNPVVKALIDATPYTRVYPNFAGDPLPTWVFHSRVTLVGDAAHTHGGSFAAGGALAIDDAYALYLAIHHVSSTEKGNIDKALRLYERTRRPHTERLLNIVMKGISNQAPVQLSEDALIQRLRNKPDTSWLSEHDVEKAFGDVIGRVDNSSQGQDAVAVRETKI